jgi:hypothetical protein
MKETNKAASRRDFLKLAGASAPAAAVALTAGGVEAEEVASCAVAGREFRFFNPACAVPAKHIS